MELNFKRLDDKAIMPIRAHESDAGLDLTAVDITLEPNDCGQTVVVYHSGLAVEIPEGYVGLLFPRSSIAKKSIFMTNGVGVIDSGYRGEIMAKMHVTTDAAPAVYKIGEKFAQLIIMPLQNIIVNEVANLSDSDRGEGGYGSSDTESSAPKEDDNVNTNSVQNDGDNSKPIDPESVTADVNDTSTQAAVESLDGSETVA